MHYQSRLLVDDNHVVVLIDDVQRNLLRLDIAFARRIGEHDGNHVVRLHLVVLLDDFVVHQDVACLGGILHTVARDVGDMVGQVSVDALWLLARVDHHAYVFIQLTAFIGFREHVVPTWGIGKHGVYAFWKQFVVWS